MGVDLIQRDVTGNGRPAFITVECGGPVIVLGGGGDGRQQSYNTPNQEVMASVHRVWFYADRDPFSTIKLTI